MKKDNIRRDKTSKFVSPDPKQGEAVISLATRVTRYAKQMRVPARERRGRWQHKLSWSTSDGCHEVEEGAMRIVADGRTRLGAVVTFGALPGCSPGP